MAEFRLRSVAGALPQSVEPSEFIRQVLVSASEKKAVPFRENVAKSIAACRADEGIPMFRTRYAGKRMDGNVLMVCWGGRGTVEGKWFNDVPESDLELMESKGGEWKELVQKYGDKKLVEQSMLAGVRL